MRYLSISFNLTLSFVLLVAQSDDSFNNWDPFWNGVPEIFDEESVSLSEAVQILNQEGFLSDRTNYSVNDLYSNNNKYLDAISAASENLDSSGIDLFATANDNQPYECFPLPSLPLSRVRSRGPGGACPNPDNFGADALTLEEQIERLWCSATPLAGFANIPVCKSDGRQTMDSAALGDPSEVALHEPMIALPGTITLKECYLSMSHSRRRLHSGAFFILLILPSRDRE